MPHLPNMPGLAAHRISPGRQTDLADAVLATGKRVVVLLFSGRPPTAPLVFERVVVVPC